MMTRDKLDVLLSDEQIQARVRELGQQIGADFEGRDIHVIGVLKGSFVFLTDLVRAIESDRLSVDFLGLSSYGSSTSTSGEVRMTQDLSIPIEGRHVLVVEDIIDTGLTMKYLVENLRARGPASVTVCTLLQKPANHAVSVKMDYVGFQIPNAFVIGYGLDYAECFRNLPFIGVVRDEHRHLLAD